MRWKEIDRSYKNRIKELERLSPFELFEIPSDASEQVLKKAYREKVKLYHPDKADPFMKSYGEEIMKIINDAYQKARNELQHDD